MVSFSGFANAEGSECVCRTRTVVRIRCEKPKKTCCCETKEVKEVKEEVPCCVKKVVEKVRCRKVRVRKCCECKATASPTATPTPVPAPKPAAA